MDYLQLIITETVRAEAEIGPASYLVPLIVAGIAAHWFITELSRTYEHGRGPGPLGLLLLSLLGGVFLVVSILVATKTVTIPAIVALAYIIVMAAIRRRVEPAVDVEPIIRD